MKAESLKVMTWDRWKAMPEVERAKVRDLSDLSPQLVGLEGRRVEVVDREGDKPRRFCVGKSTGWRPVHLEMHNARSIDGGPASKQYHEVRVVR